MQKEQIKTIAIWVMLLIIVTMLTYPLIRSFYIEYKADRDPSALSKKELYEFMKQDKEEKSYEYSDFKLISQNGAGGYAGYEYVYGGGLKNLDVRYVHDPKGWPATGICFEVINPSELSYPTLDYVEDKLSSPLCITDLTDEIVKALNKGFVTDTKTSKDYIDGEQTTRDYFSGYANIRISGYTLDTRATETFNKIDLVKINQVYK